MPAVQAASIIATENRGERRMTPRRWVVERWGLLWERRLRLSLVDVIRSCQRMAGARAFISWSCRERLFLVRRRGRLMRRIVVVVTMVKRLRRIVRGGFRVEK